MTEEKKKKQSNAAAGYLFIVAGLLGFGSRFIGDVSWTTISIIKLIIPIAVIACGLWMVLKKN